MKKTAEKREPMTAVIEKAFDYGRLISYGEVWAFVGDLETAKAQIDHLVTHGEARRAVGLYELLMAGCCEKIEEVDDSGGHIGIFFEELFCSWICARQKAALAPEETVQQMLKLMDNDDYGLCFGIERRAVEVLNKNEMTLFKGMISSRFEDAISSEKSPEQKIIYDFAYAVRRNADILKAIYAASKDTDGYLALCDRVGMTPKDCEAIANIRKAKRQWEKALYFVDKGLSLEREKDWPNQSSFNLSGMRRELLNKTGHKDEALQTAWEDFTEAPSEYSYKELMKYVPKEGAKEWHHKALVKAGERSLSGFIDVCTSVREWDLLAKHILSVDHRELEGISHYTTEEAAERLAKTHHTAAAKVYCALGMRILNRKKSKYYPHALDYVERAKKLSHKSGLENEWIAVVTRVRTDHARKYGFIGDFERVIQGYAPQDTSSFLERTQKRWRKQVT